MNRIKLAGIIIGLMALTAVAQNVGRVAYGYVSDGTGITGGSVLPGPTLIGIPTFVGTERIKSVTVTVADFRDGGSSDYQQVGNGRLIALIGKNEVRDPDGGIQWARYPAFDIEVDGGNPFIPGGGGAVTYSVQLNSASLGLGSGKLLYYSQAVVAADGGALPHRVYFEGSY